MLGLKFPVKRATKCTSRYQTIPEDLQFDGLNLTSDMALYRLNTGK